jgi:hypothetical protein
VFILGESYIRKNTGTVWKYCGEVFNGVQQHLFCSKDHPRNALLIKVGDLVEINLFERQARKRDVKVQLWFKDFDSEPVLYEGQIGGLKVSVSKTISEESFIEKKPEDNLRAGIFPKHWVIKAFDEAGAVQFREENPFFKPLADNMVEIVPEVGGQIV